MVYLVDFSIKENDNFRDVHSAFITADSVKECRNEAEKICDSLFHNKKIYIFIEA